MFSDDLYQIISENLITNIKFKKVFEKYIQNREPITENIPEALLARFLFAKTLKELLENPDSVLSHKLRDKDLLRDTLQNIYIYSISQINRRQFIVPMPGPFVVPDILTITGKLVDIIAEGSYGEVYKTDKDFVIKKIIKEQLDSFTTREIAILHYLDHPNIINIKAVQLKPPQFALPLARGTIKMLGDMGALKMFGDQKAELETRKWIFYQLFRGMAYCHSKHVWHLDIKPDNILIFNDNIAKLADFGTSIPYARRGTNDPFVGTLWWRAPELLLDDYNYDESADVWALGVTLLGAVVGHYIFTQYSKLDNLYEIFKLLGTPTDSEWPGVSKLLESVESDPDPKTQETQKVVFPQWKRTLDISTLGKQPIRFDQQEFDVIDKIVTWPNRRASALEVLRLPYFDSVRDKIEIQIPALPVEVKSCGDLMRKDQRQFVKQKELSSIDRSKMFEWLWNVHDRFRTLKRTLFYALELFDIVLEQEKIKRFDMQKYAGAAMFIASQLFELVPSSEGDLVWISAKKFTISQLQEAVRHILTIIDFQLIFPTCNDFINEYTNGMIPTKVGRINHTAFRLYLNYDYATQYSASQLAQIAIEANNLKLECLKDIEPLYTTAINEYLVHSTMLYSWLQKPAI